MSQRDGVRLPCLQLHIPFIEQMYCLQTISLSVVLHEVILSLNWFLLPCAHLPPLTALCKLVIRVGLCICINMRTVVGCWWLVVDGCWVLMGCDWQERGAVARGGHTNKPSTPFGAVWHCSERGGVRGASRPCLF